MAFFKFRNAGDETPAAPQPGESVEVLRRRARHRLIGATVLVLVAVLGFPLIFDKQPRPIPVDIPIEIPDKNKAKPLAIPAAPVAEAASASAPPATGTAPTAVAQVAPTPAPATPAVQTPATPQTSAGKVGGAESVVPSAKPPAASATDKLPLKPEPAKPETKVADKPAPSNQALEAARAQALLEGRAAPAAAVTAAAAPASGGAEERFIVQVGAFADAAKVRDTRQKLERAGLKTFTQVAKTAEGERTRVRLGPFAKRADAEAAAAKVKKLDMPAAILTL